MKTKAFTFVLLFGILITNCSVENDEGLSDENLSEISIHGTWNLKSIADVSAPGNQSNFEDGEIKWVFDVRDSSLCVVNNAVQNDNGPVVGYLLSGNYEFAQIGQSNGEIFLVLDPVAFLDGAELIEDGSEMTINTAITLNGASTDNEILRLERVN